MGTPAAQKAGHVVFPLPGHCVRSAFSDGASTHTGYAWRWKAQIGQYMKLRRALIANFKGVRELEIQFAAGGELRPLTVLVGDNGSGKTTVLQAIALTLSLATRRTRDVTSFNWHGFIPERVGSLGPTRVELDVILEPEEVALTTQLYEEWVQQLSADYRQTHRLVTPSEHTEICLVYEAGRVSAKQGFAAVNQFLGRYYALGLAKTQRDKRGWLAKFGSAFWFDQYRNLGSVGNADETQSSEGWTTGVEQLREYLVGWWAYHMTPLKPGGSKDFLAIMEPYLAQIFPGTRFAGIAPREGSAAPSGRDFYFLLERDGKRYDLAEMSSGEQAIFPLLYEFIRLDIARSVALIDELELHLHPPEQQTLLAALPKLGSDCQFIITTHSPFLIDVIPQDQQVRLAGGRLCL